MTGRFSYMPPDIWHERFMHISGFVEVQVLVSKSKNNLKTFSTSDLRVRPVWNSPSISASSLCCRCSFMPPEEAWTYYIMMELLSVMLCDSIEYSSTSSTFDTAEKRKAKQVYKILACKWKEAQTPSHFNFVHLSQNDRRSFYCPPWVPSISSRTLIELSYDSLLSHKYIQ